MKFHRIFLAGLMALGAATVLVRPAQAQLDPAPGVTEPFFFTHYYDVATSTLPSASGYGGNGASGGIGDGLVRIVNGDNVFVPPPYFYQNGTICAMIYVFDDIEEMQACCGCPVTPDGVRTMSVINNLAKNFGVNRGNMNAGVIDILATTPNLPLPGPVPLPPQIGTLGSSGLACDPSFQFGPTIGVTFGEVAYAAPGLRAWMTDTEGNSPVPATSKNLITGTSVSEFQPAVFDTAPPFTHLIDLGNFCLFLINNGGGTGACSCGSGDDFSKAAQPIR